MLCAKVFVTSCGDVGTCALCCVSHVMYAEACLFALLIKVCVFLCCAVIGVFALCVVCCKVTRSLLVLRADVCISVFCVLIVIISISFNVCFHTS